MGIEAVDVIAKQGMVTSDNYIATRVGSEILRRGGNAVDAAVGTALALCVVKPSSNGIAGYGGCMVIYLADAKRVVAIDYNCRAPKAATPDMYELAEGWEACGPGQLPPVVDQKNFLGPLAVSVPATISGLSLAEAKFGRLGWAAVLEPAIRLAAEGFPLWPGLHENLKGFAEGTDPESAAVFFPDGRIPKDGEIWVQPELAKLLEILAADPDVFYRGDVARRIVERVQARGGILSEEDMAEYHADCLEPLDFEYRGVGIYASPGLTGSPTTLEALAVLEALHPEPYSADDPLYWGDLADTLTLVWRDRFAFLGDVPGIREKIRELISRENAEMLAEMVRRGKVEILPTAVCCSTHTVHVSTCDADRNMVSLTQTHGAGWGTRFAIPGLGIVLGHGMSRFDPRPGRANSVGPRKAVLHNMSPVILLLKGEPFAAIGMPGGRTIPSVIPQFVVDVVDFGMTPGEMLSRPRICSEGGPIQVTADLPDSARKEMGRRGHEIRTIDAVGGLASGLILRDDAIIGSAQAGPDASVGI